MGYIEHILRQKTTLNLTHSKYRDNKNWQFIVIFQWRGLRPHYPLVGGRSADRRLISSRISSARQAVHRGDSLTGFGYRPDLTPFHQLVLPRGITLSTCGKRRNPVSGISYISKPFTFTTSYFTTTGARMSRRIALTASCSPMLRCGRIARGTPFKDIWAYHRHRGGNAQPLARHLPQRVCVTVLNPLRLATRREAFPA